MAKGYWVAHVTVTDPENYPKYIAANAAAFHTLAAFVAGLIVIFGAIALFERSQRAEA